MTAKWPEPILPRCAVCGDQRGPWRPTGERYPSGAQALACTNCTPAAETAARRPVNGSYARGGTTN